MNRRSINYIRMSERPHERYSRVFFDIDWLDDWLFNTLGISDNALRSNSEFKKDKGKRSVFFWAVKEYGGLDKAQICRRYGQSHNEIGNMITSVQAHCFWEERSLVVKSLERFVPEPQARKLGQ